MAEQIETLGCLADYVSRFARETPDAEAIVFGSLRLTYPQLESRISEFARALIAAGIQKGDRVAVLSTPRPEAWISYLATGAIGAIWVGLNPKHRLAELHHVVNDSRPRLLVSIDAFEGRSYSADIAALQREMPEIESVVWIGNASEGFSWQEFLNRSRAVPEQTFEARKRNVARMDPALIVYTSGSTGKPKGALLSHHGLTYGAVLQTSHITVSTPVTVVNFPISHVAFLADTCATTLVSGGKIVLQERFDALAHLTATAVERCNIIGGVPTMFELMMRLPQAAQLDLSSLEVIIWGGAAMPREQIARLREWCPRVMNVYGMTETSCNVTYTPKDADLDALADSIGMPDPRCPLRIVSEEGVICRVGEVGELQFKGDYLMLGYWNRPEATRDAFSSEGWMRTGDLGYWREDGNVTLVGRRFEMFKSGGYNVYPREVEMTLEQHPAVAMAAVIAVPDALYQEVGHAFVLPMAGASLDEAELRAHCQQKLANYKVPKRLFVRQELPLLAVGKVDKVALKAAAG